jgi:hypothetical protein
LVFAGQGSRHGTISLLLHLQLQHGGLYRIIKTLGLKLQQKKASKHLVTTAKRID